MLPPVRAGRVRHVQVVGGGRCLNEDDDDLDVTWVGSSGAAEDIDAAAGETLNMEDSYGVSFGRGENDALSPRSTNSNNSGSSSSTSSSKSNGASSSGSDVRDNGSRGGGAAELSKGTAQRL